MNIERTPFEQFALPLADALIIGMVAYLIIRLVIGLAYLKSKRRPHSLWAFLWLVGAHLVALQVLNYPPSYLVLALPACFLIAFKLKADIPTVLNDDTTLVLPAEDVLPLWELSDKYDIRKELGKGGMGVVLLATDRNLNRQVAIKRILAPDPSSLKRFTTEAKAIAAMDHVNIVRIYEFARDSVGPYLVLEYVSGGSLLDRLKDGTLDAEETIGIACQLCDALTEAHQNGIIHRDIKPANILLTEEGVPKLTDFGLARFLESEEGQTKTGEGMGTPIYMSPEQRRDAKSVDARTDQFSLALTCCHALTGEVQPIDLELIPPNLRKPLQKALSKLPENRFDTAADFKQALQGASLPGGRTCPRCKSVNFSSQESCPDCGERTTAPDLNETSSINCTESITTFTPVDSNSQVTLNTIESDGPTSVNAVLSAELRIARRLEECDGYEHPDYETFQVNRKHLGFENANWHRIREMVRYNQAFEVKSQELIGCPEDYTIALGVFSDVLQKQIENMHHSIYTSKSGRRLDDVLLAREGLNERHSEAKQDWLTARSVYLD